MIATILAVALGHAATAAAQMPSSAQRNAIRQSCARDYQAMCASVPTGGSASLQCLRSNMSSLSPPCQSAVAAISSGGSPAAAPSAAPAPAPPPAQACRADFRALCGGIRPGGGRAMMCLREHRMELSPTCQASLGAMRR